MKRFLLASLLALPWSLAAPEKASAGFELNIGGSFDFSISCSGSGCGRCGGLCGKRGCSGCNDGYGYGWGDNVYYGGETVAPPLAPSGTTQKTSYESYQPAYGYQPVGYYYQPAGYSYQPSYWYGR